MATGERIKYIRKLRGLTQKELGMAVGFTEKTADVRMAQYEAGARSPKAELTAAIANVLKVSPQALAVPDIDTLVGVMHTLFAVEDMYGVPEGNEDLLVFKDMVREWREQAEKCRNGEISKEEYDAWRYNYSGL